MSLPTTPPRYASWAAMLAPIKQGETGWRAYAIQRVLGVTADGDFGPLTAAALKGWQAKHGLVDDAIAGPATQTAMLAATAAKIEADDDLPIGLLTGFAVYEGAGILAATNYYTPTGALPGVDCGPVQWRQNGPPFAPEGLKAAFDARQAFQYAGDIFTRRLADYTARRPTLGRRRLVETAVLAHNAPFLAEQIVRNGRLTTPDAIAAWTTKPDGTHYTHAEWAIEYPSRILEGVDY